MYIYYLLSAPSHMETGTLESKTLSQQITKPKNVNNFLRSGTAPMAQDVNSNTAKRNILFNSKESPKGNLLLVYQIRAKLVSLIKS